VDDLIDGIYRLLLSERTHAGQHWTPTETSILEIRQAHQPSHTQQRQGLVYKPDNRLGDDPQRRRPDITRAQSILGWEPKVDLEEGLRAYDRLFQAKDGNSMTVILTNRWSGRAS